jgi:putative DNA primase/helicase
MHAANYDDVLGQLLDAGLIIPPGEGLRIGTHKPVREFTQDGGRERRGWYLLKEWSPSVDRLLIVGSFGVWRGNEKHAQKVILPKDDVGRITPEQRAAMKRMYAEAAKAAELQREKETATAAERARRVWARLLPDGDSPYLASKGIIGHGVKYTEHGTAVLQLNDTAGKVHGLQFLRTPAQAKESGRHAKEFWPPGLAKKGHFHLLGHEPHWIVLLAEGYATAASLHEATGYPVVCAFDAGNLPPVAEALRKRWKQTRILVCADDDCFTDGNPGVTAASAAAMAVSGEWMRPVFADDAARRAAYEANGRKLTDFNDLQAIEGAAAVRAQVSARITELRWGPPELRGVSSSSTGGAGYKLKAMQSLDELLPRFATLYGGKEGVFDGVDHAIVSETDVRNLCARSELFKAWKEHPDRRIHRLDEVGFDPACTDTAVTCNLWGGWPTMPKPGTCDLLLDTLRHMCSGERNSSELFDWVLKWIAYPIQHPGAKMKTTVVVHGPQGTGKNLFFESVMSIYGKYGRILDQSALQDKHNDCFSRKLFMIADEVIAQKERYDIKNLLKTLITGTWIRINPKHVAAYEEANHVNLVFLSNESMPVVLEEDDRRHCVLWTPPKKPPEFYESLMVEIESGGVEALHDYLLNLPLGKFNPGSMPPDTEAKRELIDLAQDSPVEFVDAVLRGDVAGVMTSVDEFGEDKGEFPCPGLTQDWFDAYRTWCSQVGVKPASLKRFVSALEKRRNLRAVRKRYYVTDEVALGGIKEVGPHSVLLFVLSCPPGEKELVWLGKYVQRLKDHVKGTRGGIR